MNALFAALFLCLLCALPATAQIENRHKDMRHSHPHPHPHSSYNKRFKTKVVVYIPSKLSSADRRLPVNRQFAREKWSREEVVILWLLGTKTGPRLEKDLNTSSVLSEPYMHAENVVFTPCRDDGDAPNNANGTSATTCKFYEGVKHIYEHYEAQYAIRGADDAYLNIRKFLSLAPSFPQTALWLGQARDSTRNFDLAMDKAHPELAKLFGLTHFSTNYMLGMGFVFTWDVVRLIGQWNIPPHLTWCEDVMVGMFLNVFQINRVNRPDLFVNRGGSVGNANYLDGTYGLLDVILLHYIRPEDWARIENNGTIYIPGPA